MFSNEKNSELREFVTPRQRQAQRVAASVRRLVRSGNQIKRQDQVVD